MAIHTITPACPTGWQARPTSFTPNAPPRLQSPPPVRKASGDLPGPAATVRRQAACAQAVAEHHQQAEPSSHRAPPCHPMFTCEGPTMAFGGHRGLGEDLLDTRPGAPVRECMENTISSFLKAAEVEQIGFVEFDVQVTKDGVPVIYHDDYILTGAPDAPVRRRVVDITLEEFHALRPSCSGDSAHARNDDVTLLRNFKDAATYKRSHGVTPWEACVAEPMPTLKELLDALPPGLGVDIEIKMAPPHEYAARTPESEVDRMLRPVLAVLADMADHTRPVMFSSFDPEICGGLVERLRAWHAPAAAAGVPRPAVLLLTTGGHAAHGGPTHADSRRNSLAEAVVHASLEGLDGVVMATEALHDMPRMAQFANANGLAVVTYGAPNCNAAWLHEQRALGVAAAIIDRAPTVLAEFDALDTKPLIVALSETPSLQAQPLPMPMGVQAA